MSEEYIRGTRPPHTHYDHAERAMQREHSGEESASAIHSSDDATSTRLLLGDTRLSGRGNSAVRQAALHTMQRTYGNRAVQRSIQRSAPTSAPLPVQREEEEELTSPKITPLPNPKLELPFGGGLIGSVDPVESSLAYKGAKGKYGEYKLGYEYGGTLVGEAKRGPWWAKAKYGKEGYGVGIGAGGPILNRPGGSPRISDPSADLREGDPNPAKIGKSLDEIGESKKGPSVGVEVGRDKRPKDEGGVGDYVIVSGRGSHDIGGGPINKPRPKPKEHKRDAPDVEPSGGAEMIDRKQLQKGIDEYKAQQRLRQLGQEFVPDILK